MILPKFNIQQRASELLTKSPAAAAAAMQQKVRASQSGGVYNPGNAVTANDSRAWEAVNRQNYQGFTFNVVNGNSSQVLTFPGDISIIKGICASFDDASNPGFNCTLQMVVNNENCYNSVDLQLLNIRRFIVAPGYLPLNKVVASQSTFTLNFNNGTGATISNVNFILVYC